MDKLENYILSHLRAVFKPPANNIRHPFLAPGAGYSDELWGWDAYWEAVSVTSAFDVFGERKMLDAGVSRQTAVEHIRGSVLDFLDAQEPDGFIPIMVAGDGLFAGFFKSEHEKGVPLNQHLPFLCRFALLASEFSGSYDWFDVDKLARYIDYFETRQFDANSGLFFWQDDIMIGIDNNPTVFYRPHKSGADVFLNSFMYLEYRAMAELSQKRGDRRADEYRAKADDLKAAINAEMWDERDGMYYSQDIGFFKTERSVKGVELHSGLAPHWKAMPLKIRFWACFLPMYAGICDDGKAERMCKHLSENDDIFARYGIRSLAKNEKMYSLAASGNPSNWLGAVWVVANYCVYKGLVRYRKTELAEKLRAATLDLLNKAVGERGDFYESYHPDTGEPFLHAGFLSFNLLVTDMLK